MRAPSLAGAFIASLLAATALTPLSAADMTTERALNVQKEPQNWLLHHGNYQGYRFSLPAGWLAFTGRELNPLDRDEGFQITSSSLPGLFLAQRPKTCAIAIADPPCKQVRLLLPPRDCGEPFVSVPFMH